MQPEVASRLFRRLDRELWLVSAQAGGRRGGLIATFVLQASIVPELPRVLVALAKQHQTHALVEASGAFGLHLLGEEHLEWAWRFGLRSGREVDKLDGLEVRVGESGAPILTGALAWLDCRVEAAWDGGDRSVFLAEVVDAEPGPDRPALTADRLWRSATVERRRELDDRMARDVAVDAEAIRAWRRARSEAGEIPWKRT